MVKYTALLCVILISVYKKAIPEKTTQVEVRAVLINCEPDHGQSIAFDNDATRFEREELFKHSVLRNCIKKIGLTVKITSDPTQNSGDEYIPIEHVFQGPKKRVRLLNPYVLRLRRELPIQAYKLRKIDTVSGTLAKEMALRDSMKLNLEPSDVFSVQKLANNSREFSQDSESYERFNELCLSRNKRQEMSIEGSLKTVRKAHNIPNSNFASGLNLDDQMNVDDETTRHTVFHDGLIDESVNFDDKTQPDESRAEDYKPILDEIVALKTNKPKRDGVRTKTEWSDLDEPNTSNQIKTKKEMSSNELGYDNGKEYNMYEIGYADIWYTIQVQLFEKLPTPDGKTTWNDLTKGKPARVSSLSPEWTGQDMSILYKSSEWIPREEFTLPVTSMCLLAPVSSKACVTLKPADTDADQYIVVPREDVLGLPCDENGTMKREEDLSKSDEQSIRRVVIRTSRALLGGDGDKAKIVNKDGDQFLTLVHKQPYHAQIELETRADDNQLVHVGSLGRIMTMVSDSSRRTRSVLTVQVTNTGLAAARFKVATRECIPEIPELLNERKNNPDDSFIVLPPKHTQSILLDVPTEIPVDVAHCSVVLINGDRQSVAVRDLTIRKGDRCFCVWHCECVCLSEDPKLLCREMPESRQIAAGLSLRERTRHVRSVCYPNVISLNLCFAASGVIACLMFFGLVKACLGLVFRCIGTWGLPHILQMPRKLDHYYEPSLHNRKLVYDDEGWPVHPDTMERTVHLISMPMEFVLNTIFFVAAPCIIIYDALRQMCGRYKKSDCGANNCKLKTNAMNNNTKTKKCFSSHDMQETNTHWRRRRWRLQRWMTPEAQNLTSNVMQDGIPNRASMIRHTMRPLLRENLSRGDEASRPVACGDSELEDTEYVLMQMQKSRESLAKSQRRMNGAVAAMTKKE